MPKRRTPTAPRWIVYDGEDPPRPVPGAHAKDDPFDIHGAEARRAQAQAERERRDFQALLLAVREELRLEEMAR